ncbi:MAG: hypothetical protein ABR597_06685 [Bacteroidales bacterium]
MNRITNKMLSYFYTQLCKFSEWMDEGSRSNFILLLLPALFIFFNVFVIPYFINLYGLQDHELLDLQFGFTPEFAHAVLADYGEYGRHGIMVFTGIVDTAYPLVYGSLLTLFISRLKMKSNARNNSLQIINLTPFIAVLFDLMENIGILMMIQYYPGQIIPVARVTSIAGIFKWIFLGSSVLILLFLLIRTLIYWRKGRK